LDEIGELPLPLQVKLLRFLQARQIERVGGRATIDVDVRVLAATHVDLGQAIGQGRFREDLYYRLNVIEIVLPPLRARGEDILLLAKALLHRYAAEPKRKLSGFDRHAMTALATYGWPGNVRELENRIRRAVIMASGPLLTPEDLGFCTPSAVSKPQTLQEARAVIEADLIRQALARNNRNISRTAAELGLSRPTLEWMQKYGLQARSGLVPQWRSAEATTLTSMRQGPQWQRHFSIRKSRSRRREFRLALLMLVMLLVSVTRGFWMLRIGQNLVCTEEISPSDVILVENFDPHYLVFERAAALHKAGLAVRVVVPTDASRDPERANPVSQGITELMARVARLQDPELLPIRISEPVSLNAAYQIRDFLTKSTLDRSSL
jgi:hypothetical protein